MPSQIKGLDGGSIGSDSSSPVEKARVTSPVNSGSAETSASVPQGDSVQVSDTARSLSALSRTLSETPDVNMSRVAELQQSIASGSYLINPERIADSMLQLEQQLGSAKK